MSAAKRKVKPIVGICDSPFHPEWYGKSCACSSCHPVGFCVDDPCQNCEGPTAKRCQPPFDDDSNEQVKRFVRPTPDYKLSFGIAFSKELVDAGYSKEGVCKMDNGEEGIVFCRR